MSDHDFATCVHEASHAAAYLAADVEIASVIEIAVNGDSGYCRARTRRGYKLPAAAYLIGYVGEQRIRYGPSWRPKPEAFEQHLHLEDVAMAFDACGRDVDAMLAAWNEAAEFVAANWTAIFTIAETLDLVGTLSGEAARLIWDRCGERAG